MRTLTNAIELIKDIKNTHPQSIELARSIGSAVWNMIEGNTEAQIKACDREINTLLLNILKEKGLSQDQDQDKDKDQKQDLISTAIGGLGVLLSSVDSHAIYCTPEVLEVVEECHEKYKDSEQIKQFLLGLKREEDPRVRDAVERGVCTKEIFPKCIEKSLCDDNFYCHKCCVQQKVFRCLTCNKEGLEFYCETCWKRDHQGHKGEEFFYPVRCYGSRKKQQ